MSRRHRRVKKRLCAIVLSLSPVHWIFTQSVQVVSGLWQTALSVLIMSLYILSIYTASNTSTSLQMVTASQLHWFGKQCTYFLSKLYKFSDFMLKQLQISMNLNFHTQFRCCMNNAWLIFKNLVIFFMSPFWKGSLI